MAVIANDFHERKDLTPNVCALYVEKNYRHQGIARELLQFVSEDVFAKGMLRMYKYKFKGVL